MSRQLFLHVCVFYLLFSENAQLTSGSSKTITKARPHRGYYGDNVHEQLQTEATKEKKTVKPNIKQNNKSYSLSAWGIVGIVLSVILGGVGAYYVALFYPILCKKERKYDVIELDAV